MNRLTPFLKKALADRRIDLPDDEIALVSRFLIERLTKARFAVVPHPPTKAMLSASMSALRKGKRPSIVRIGTKRKHRHRLITAISCARIQPREPSHEP